MRKLVVSAWMSLDGVIQAPSYRDEDTDGGFAHGGWHAEYFDSLSQEWVVDGIAQADAFLFGRRTYNAFAAHWPTASEAEEPLANYLNARPKFVLSSTLTAPLPWGNSTLIHDPFPDAVLSVKESGTGSLQVIGSARLAAALLSADLVDELRLMIDPLLLGGGKRLFPAEKAKQQFSLSEIQSTSTGAILVTYARRASP